MVRAGRAKLLVSQKLESLSRFHVKITHAPQRVRVRCCGGDGGQDNSVIGSDAGCLVHRMRVSALQNDVGFAAHDEKRGGGSEAV